MDPDPLFSGGRIRLRFFFSNIGSESDFFEGWIRIRVQPTRMYNPWRVKMRVEIADYRYRPIWAKWENGFCDLDPTKILGLQNSDVQGGVQQRRAVGGGAAAGRVRHLQVPGGLQGSSDPQHLHSPGCYRWELLDL